MRKRTITVRKSRRQESERWREGIKGGESEEEIKGGEKRRQESERNRGRERRVRKRKRSPFFLIAAITQESKLLMRRRK